MIPSYPSPKHLGDRSVRNIFEGPVVVQEKIDGSQISFRLNDEGDLEVKSRSTLLNVLAPDKMFSKAVEHLQSVKDKLSPGLIYRGEYLSRPKHNVLCYDRVPVGGIALFDVFHTDSGAFAGMETVAGHASLLGLEPCPVLFEGVLAGPEALRPMLDRVSVLGGAKIEGVVVKNYALVTDIDSTFAAKFVSEEFKEVHSGTAVGAERGPKVEGATVQESLLRAHRTPARWQKAVQHLREEGKLTDTPKDIGLLVKEVQADVVAECYEDIAEALFEDFRPRLQAGVIDGLALWYKDQLVKRSFETDTNGT